MQANGGIFIKRRGSFLVAVVAILSLLAVLTIVYVTVGRSDAQLSAAVQRKSERGHPEFVMRDHIVQIIADDVTEPVDPSEIEGATVEQPLIREAWDYPSTAYYAAFFNPFTGEVESRPVTVGGDEGDVAYFLPTGEIVIRDGMNEYIVGTGTDPWLSSTEPTWLDFAGDWTTSNPEDYPSRRVDLPQISNVAPDGAFVNLFNLRADIAGFDASPWQMRGDTGIGATLTLYDPDNLTDGVGNRGTDTDFGYTLSSSGVGEESYEAQTRPFFWSSRQVGAHRPVGDPHYLPGDALYSPYQWADADGDGAFDARWLELVIDRDPDDESWTDIFTRQGDLRYFFAVTVRDLSAMVNVNTATDGTLGPAGIEPDGISPAHIDVRRMLTLIDPTRDSAIDAAGYSAYGSISDGSDSYSSYGTIMMGEDSFKIGDRAYDALRLAINEAAMPDVLDDGSPDNPGYLGLERATGGGPANVDREFYFTGYYGGPTAPGRLDHYRTIAAFDPSAGGVWDSVGQYRSSPLFGLDSLAELLTFRRINDPSTASRLEMALHARGDFNATDPQAGFGPLRSDRLNETVSFFDDMAGDAAGRTSQFLAHSLLDVRGRLTTLSGHRPVFGADLMLPTELEPLSDAQRRTQTRLADIDMRKAFDRTLLTDPEALFQIYADGLLPWSDLTGAWSAPAYATLAYAGNIHGRLYGPELALRSAAHLAANMADIADDDNIPTRRTVLVDESYRGDLEAGGGREPAYPYILLDLNNADPNTGRLDPGGGGLIDPTGTYGRAINVFGIEAQPFITMAGTMAVYADTTTAGGGNVEKAAPGPIPPTGPANALIPDLDSTFSASNADFLFEAIAVELTNPFDVDIELAGDVTETGGFDYYIQFGDLYFRVAEYDRTLPDAIDPGMFTLEAGESRTVFCMSQAPSEVVSRLKDATNGLVAPMDLDDWLTAQFGAEAALMWPMVEPGSLTPDLVDGTPLVSTDIPLLPDGLLNILDAGGTAMAADRDIVRLWRAVRPLIDEPAGPAIDGSSESATENDPMTDVLVDRIRVPTAEAGLLSNVRRTGGNQEIDGATPAPDGTGDNAGLTITQWAMIRRADDPDAGEFRTVAASGNFFGVLPAWAYEPVEEGSALSRPLGEDSVIGPGDQLKMSNFSAPENHGGSTIADWFMATETAPATNTIFPTLTQDPADRASDLVAAIVGTRVEHRLTTDGNSTISVPRLADLLLPLAIGPMHDPGPDLAVTSDDRWVTLSEALTFATTGLESVTTGPSPYTDLDNFYDGVGVELTSGVGDVPLFFGQLVVDNFVPFFDADLNGAYDPPALGGSDVAWGLRISPAMRIIQSVAGFTREQASLIRPVFGTLNINTAPLETLRSLPMLSPPVGIDDGLAADFGSAYGNDSMWWWDNLASPPAPLAGPHSVGGDIASTLVGYRDRQRLLTRSPAGTTVMPSVLDFLDSGSTLSGDGPPGYDSTDTGRGNAIGFAGTTERPGIRSIGELLTVRDFNAPAEHSMDALFGASDISLPGVAGTLYDDGTGLVGDGTFDASGDPTPDYDQQFAIANSVFNTISIGSDYYAVWFLMHGYSEEDTMVTGADPLVPTVARRFLMVVDRSGVTRRGDEPKIVLFREVPVALP